MIDAKTQKKSREERMEEFLEYHLRGDGEANGIILKEFADRNKYNDVERFDLAYFYSITYCILSAIYLLKRKTDIVADPAQFAGETKKKIIFQSDRRYVRTGDNYRKMLEYYSLSINGVQMDLIDAMRTGGKFTLPRIEAIVKEWYFFGRFSTYLFAETLGRLFGHGLGTNKFDWNQGDTATSGMLNLMTFDRSADYFDRTGKLPKGINTQQLDVAMKILEQKITARGGTPITAEIETSLCAYRKFYKGSRYNGYYLDRILEEILWYKNEPFLRTEVEELLQIRKEKFAEKYLGEIGGWTGIRKNLKTLYKETGKVT